MERAGPGGEGTDRQPRRVDPSSPEQSDGRQLSKDAEMRALFAALDKDKNGYIDKTELRVTMLEVGLDLSENDLDTMMKAAGVIIKDRIFYEDFVRLMTGSIGQSQRKALLKQASNDEPSAYIISGDEEETEVQAMRVAFSMFDRDGDGLISEQEVHDTMTSLGIKISLKEVKQIVRRVDPNCDGMIGFDKFLMAMRKYQTGRAKDAKSRCSTINSGTEDSSSDSAGAGGCQLDPQQRELVDAAFHVFDKDRDGFLNAHDLRVTMQQLGLVLCEEDVHAMMKSVGIGPQGKISHADFCRIYSSKTAVNAEQQRSKGCDELAVSKRQEAEFRAVFSIFDVDRDGYITMEEVVEVLVSMGIHPSRDCIAEVFHQVDLDGNGKIDFREFLLLINKYERPLPENIEMREMFNALDKDRNGIVDQKELKASFAELGIPLTDSDVRAMMREAHVQGDQISYEDFVRIMACQMNNTSASSTSTSNRQTKSQPTVADNGDKCKSSGGTERQGSARNTRGTSACGREINSDLSSRSSAEVCRKSSTKSPSRSQSTSRSERTPRGSIKSTSSSRPSAQTDHVPLESRSRKVDAIRPVSGEIDRAIYASLESAAKSEQRRQRSRTNHDTKHDEVREFFSESLVIETTKPLSSSSDTNLEPIPPSKTSTSKAPSTWIAFKVFDRNSDGYISKVELHRTMNDLGIVLSKEDLDIMMDEADINKDGRIDYAEFSKLMNGSFEAYAHQAAQLQERRRTLAQSSLQSNGTISSGTDLPPTITTTSPTYPISSPASVTPTSPSTSPLHSPPPSISQSPSIILTEQQLPPPPYRPPPPPYAPPPLPEDVDEEKDGVILAVSAEESMRAAFKAFDINGDGLIDPTELRKTMKRLGETLSEDDVNAMIRVVDKNFDGKVDYEEFIQLMQFSA